MYSKSQHGERVDDGAAPPPRRLRDDIVHRAGTHSQCGHLGLSRARALARDYVAVTIPEDIGYFILVTVFAPRIEEFTKIFPLLNRYAETEKSIIKLGFLSGLGFGIAEFFVYVVYFSAPVSIRLPEMFFHAANTSLVASGVAKHKFLRY
jgi:hypothetical protein